MGIRFDAINDEITFGTNDDIMTENGALTISAWVFANTTGEGGAGCIVSRGTVGVSGANLVFIGTNGLRFFVNGTTTLDRQGSTNTLNLSTWNHVVATWDGSTSVANVHLYVNGSEISSASSSNGATLADNSGTTLRIGNRSSGAFTWDGIIDEVAMWNSVLTLNEISILSKSRLRGIPLQISPTNLKRYWPLDDFSDNSVASGTNSIKDMSSNKVDGTPNNSPLGVSGQVLSYQP